MKKLLLLSVCALAISSCHKKDCPKPANLLVNTKWINAADQGQIISFGLNDMSFNGGGTYPYTLAHDTLRVPEVFNTIAKVVIAKDSLIMTGIQVNGATTHWYRF